MPDAVYSFFILPDGAYLEAAKPVPLSRYPEGTIAVEQRPSPNHGWVDGAWADQTDTAAELTAERAGMVVSRFQAKAALSAAGLLASVETAISGADAFVQLAWAEAVEFKRNSPTIATLAAALELTDTEIDDLFRAAAVIEA